MNLLDIEKELAGEDGEAAMKRYDQMLADLDQRIVQALNDGLPPNEYSAATQLKEAVLLARKVLRLSLRDVKGA